MVRLFSQTLATISTGELNQAFDAFNPDQAPKHYFDRITKKTASLFVLATESGAILSQAPERAIEILREYGHSLGIAFQIVDDMLDVVGETKLLGKTVGKDDLSGKATYPKAVGLERSSEIAAELIESAKQDIAKLSVPCEVFKVLADLILSRQS